MVRRKIFVAGFASETSEEDLKEYFSVYGALTDVVVMRGESDSRVGGRRSIVCCVATESLVKSACSFRLEPDGKTALCADKMTGNGRGFGFVTFQDRNGACARKTLRMTFAPASLP